MNNEETKAERALEELKELAGRGLINKEQVLAIFESEKEPAGFQRFPFTFQRLLYFVGGFIIILGVGIFVAQFWGGWTQITKVIFSLGLSASFYAIGYYLHSSRPDLLIFSRVSLILSAMLLPLGIGTFLDLIGISAATSAGLSINFAFLFIIYFISYRTLKEDIFLLSTLATAGGFFINFTDFLIKEPPISSFSEYRLLFLGAAYFALGYHYSKFFKKYIVNLLYLFGLLMLLGVAFALSIDSFFWLFAFPFLLAAVFYTSVALQSKLILSLGTFFTFAEIARITGEYFSGSLGWPITLIIAGFGIMLVGYLSFKVSKKYISDQQE